MKPARAAGRSVPGPLLLVGWVVLQAGCGGDERPDDFDPDGGRDAAVFDRPSGEVAGPTRTGRWSDRTPCAPEGGSPTPRADAVAAYDPVRKRMLLVGGTAGGDREGVWEWDGTSGGWVDRTPCPRPAVWPAARRSSSLTWDPDRARLVLVGGLGARGALEEVWEWDGTAWTSRAAPAGSPAGWGRFAHGAVYDPGRRRLVIFGGRTVRGGALLDSTWEWEPATGAWSDRSLPASAGPRPAARQDPLLAAGGPTVLLTGGASAAGAVLDLWEWAPDSAVWREISTSGERPAVGRAAIFTAGVGTATLVDPIERRAWDLDGATGRWLRRTPWGDAPLAPATRARATAARDGGRGVITLFGGLDRDGLPLGDTWELLEVDGSWRDRTPTPAAPWTLPRAGAAMAWDAMREQLLRAGGVDHLGRPWMDVQRWDDPSGRWVTTKPAGAGPSPAPRWGHVAAFDEHRGVLVVFGGEGRADRWEWNPALAEWTDRTPAPLPSSWPAARADAALAYDGKARRMVLFGGRSDAGVALDELWTWSTGTDGWEAVPRAATWPAARAGHAVAADPRDGSLWLFGGVGKDGKPLDDLWELEPSTGAWTRRAPGFNGDGPSPRWGHAMAVDATGVVAVVGGADARGVLAELWLWDGLWRRGVTTGAAEPPARFRASLAFDRRRGRLVLFGGSGDLDAAPSGYESARFDHWEWTIP